MIHTPGIKHKDCDNLSESVLDILSIGPLGQYKIRWARRLHMPFIPFLGKSVCNQCGESWVSYIPPLQHCQALSNRKCPSRVFEHSHLWPCTRCELGTLGCCLNCNMVPNASAGGCESIILR